MSKPVLYTFGISVWSAAPELAIAELYPEGAIDKQVVNVVEGGNFAPEYLKINPHGTVPALLADGKTYVSTAQVTRYLLENAPKKVASGTSFIDKIHDDKYDPNFPLLITRNEEELKAAASGFPLTFVSNRQNALDKYAKSAEGSPFKEFYDAKLAGNGSVLSIYKGEVSDDVKKGFFNQCTKHWETLSSFILNDLPSILPDSGFLGGAEPGEDDYHLAAWLSRIGFLTGGKPEKDGYKAIEKETKQPIPAKVVAYWQAWAARPSWQKVYADGLH
ncbi:hypothetical protein CERSUDRAFT_110368 [Gelatoporia subvermispora B]|uniref:GST N-terminal domain-containing protein n=1 Tax=Ceriporiopsis subvermispora (strain B) TaxID=914234 RepID=M2RSA2_CERS8|nr:hypothetical protein CERSUDRAFT_110368 [Gelatoporia subvermispora B]